MIRQLNDKPGRGYKIDLIGYGDIGHMARDTYEIKTVSARQPGRRISNIALIRRNIGTAW